MGGLVSATRGGIDLLLPSAGRPFDPPRRGIRRVDGWKPELEILAIPGVRSYPYGKNISEEFRGICGYWTQVPETLRSARAVPASHILLAARPLHAYQQKGADFLIANEGALLGWNVGLGKEQPVDTKVLTPTGWRCIGDLAVGDLVLGSAGSAVRVRGVYPQGVRPSYRVTFSDHSSVEAGAAHLWTMTYTSGGRERFQVVLTTQQLSERPKIRLVRKFQDLAKTRLGIPMMAPALFDALPLPLPPYLLGQFLGNGGLTCGAQLTTFVGDWPEVIARLELKPSAARQYVNVIQAHFSDLQPALRELGLARKSSREKFIPRVYFRAPPVDRIALLHGLMDTDGSISPTRNRVIFHSTCKRLAEDVQELVECLGGVASTRSYDRSAEGKPTDYQVRIRVGFCPFLIKRKADRWKPSFHASPRRNLTSVEYVRDVESVCIAVDAPDQLYATERAILTHNTVVAAAAAATVHRGFPTLICAPLSLRDNWRRELEATGLSNGSDFTSLSSRISSADFRDKAKLKRLGADFSSSRWVFVHYDVLEAWAGWLRWERFPVVIFDESHRLRGRNSQRARGAGIAALEARHVWCLSGTPMANGPADLYPQLNLMHPGAWGSYTDFCGRYAGRSRTAFGFNNSGTVDEQYVLELQARLAHCLDRKTRQDVGLELPPLSLVDVTMEDQAIQLAHQQVLGNMDAELLLEHILSGGKLGSGVLAILNSMRLETSKAKISLTAEYCANLQLQGERVLIFTWYKEVAKALADRLRGYCVDGDMKPDLRDKISQHFQTGAGFPYLVATYGALGEGVNLQGVHQVVLHDLDWLPLTIIQAIGRSHRQGQRFAVTAHFMLVRGSFDEFMLRILRTKANLIEMIEQVTSELGSILNNIELTADEVSDWIGELGAWRGDW